MELKQDGKTLITTNTLAWEEELLPKKWIRERRGFIAGTNIYNASNVRKAMNGNLAIVLNAVNAGKSRKEIVDIIATLIIS